MKTRSQPYRMVRSQSGARWALALFLAVEAAFPRAASAQSYLRAEFDVFVPNDGRRVPATVCIPVGEPGQTFPAVALLHGTGSSRDEVSGAFRLFAQYMARRGVASIRLDFAGHGDSGAEMAEYCYSSGASDAAACAAFLGRLKAVDAERIGVLGWSQGGAVAMLAAARYPVFKALAVWAPALGMFGFFESKYGEAVDKGFASIDLGWRPPLTLSLRWFEEAKGLPLLEGLASFAGPVLALAGSVDSVVPLSDLDRVLESSGGADKTKILIPGADHTFRLFTADKSKFEEVERATTAWLLESL